MKSLLTLRRHAVWLTAWAAAWAASPALAEPDHGQRLAALETEATALRIALHVQDEALRQMQPADPAPTGPDWFEGLGAAAAAAALAGTVLVRRRRPSSRAPSRADTHDRRWAPDPVQEVPRPAPNYAAATFAAPPVLPAEAPMPVERRHGSDAWLDEVDLLVARGQHAQAAALFEQAMDHAEPPPPETESSAGDTDLAWLHALEAGELPARPGTLDIDLSAHDDLPELQASVRAGSAPLPSRAAALPDAAAQAFDAATGFERSRRHP